MTRRTLLTAFVVLTFAPAVFAAPVTPLVPGRHTAIIGKREYILHVPPKYDGKTPLPFVIFLHGRGGNGGVAERAYGWVPLAAKENFIVCFPSALPDRQGKPAWNAGYNAGRGGADDVAFLMELIGVIKKSVAVDPKRVYMAGHSSGAMMSYRFGAEKPSELAAIGVVAGSIGNDAAALKAHIPKPADTISVIAFHGKADTTVPYDYRITPPDNPVAKFVPALDSVRFFAGANGCNKTPKHEKSFGGNIVKETFSGGKNGAEVVLYSVGNGNHMYPGGKARRGESPNQQINATELMWTFFKAHPRP